MAYQQFVVFRLGEEHYGVNIQNVSSISEQVEITCVPNSDDRIVGIINLRGDIIPVVNLKKQFNIADITVASDSRIIIYRTKNRVVGFIVDEASQVIPIDEENIEPSPELITGENRTLIAGIGKVNGKIIILLNLEYYTDVISTHSGENFLIQKHES